ncbi:MAG TPA: cyclic nucleotide-binding domain-containing protein [Chloroflexota bacterium]|nr:cyclic nucleotide-binding domain-containing protein [Chloroflexota bacterium]
MSALIPSPTAWLDGPMPLDDEDTVQLCRVGLFQNMAPRDLMFLVRVSHTVIAEEGAVVISQNSIGDFFYVIVDGLLRITVHVNGRDIVVGYFSRGQSVGERALMENIRRTASIIAARETRLVRVPGFTFRRIMSRPENRHFVERKTNMLVRSNARLGAAVAPQAH